MKIEQIYTGCLAEAAYYIHSEGEAIIIDPLRETSPYLDRLENDDVSLKYIFLTHFHADFVSGQVDLAKKTGAKIVFGPTAEAGYEIYNAKDNEVFELGDISLHWLHTPGHTRESSTILLKDEKGKDHCIFTGDTLFIGDVGRPDLAIKQGKLTEEDLARMLYKSLREKIMPLSDDVVVYPGHGAGSACGKKMSKETFDKLGNQKQNNYALRQDMDENEFVTEVLDGLAPPPQYFPKNVLMNKGINNSIDSIIKQGTKTLSVEEFKEKVEAGALMLDVRTQQDFVKEHIPGSIFIGLNGAFAPWVGALINNIEQAIVLISPDGKEEEAVTRLSRIGYDNSAGILSGGIEAWKAEGNNIDSIKTVTVDEFEKSLKNEDLNILDVRKNGEFESEHLVGVEHMPLSKINDSMDKIDPSQEYYIYCGGGYRSVIFESILKSRGIHNLVDVLGGFGAIKKNPNLNSTNFVCPSTL